jgi:ligand-binding sensor domain-containing protein
MKLKVHKSFLFTVFFTILLSYNFPQEMPTIKFEHLTVNDGLSENAVTLVMQDSKGFIWIGTHDGLNKYDGYTFTNFIKIFQKKLIASQIVPSVLCVKIVEEIFG